MSYAVEVFKDGLRIGYGCRGRIKLQPKYYHHPSAAKVGAAAVQRNHPDVSCFINKFPLHRLRS